MDKFICGFDRDYCAIRISDVNSFKVKEEGLISMFSVVAITREARSIVLFACADRYDAQQFLDKYIGDLNG